MLRRTPQRGPGDVMVITIRRFRPSGLRIWAVVGGRCACSGVPGNRRNRRSGALWSAEAREPDTLLWLRVAVAKSFAATRPPAGPIECANLRHGARSILPPERPRRRLHRLVRPNIMKPASFDYHAPGSVDAALSVLRRYG